MTHVYYRGYMRTETRSALLVMSLAACSACSPPGRSDAPPPSSAASGPSAASVVSSAQEPRPTAPRFLTPNEFFGQGTPTFVVGTGGDDLADKKTRAQAELVRTMLFPKATLMLDTEIDAAKGAGAWPKNPVVYGGPHVNTALAAIAAQLPFEMKAGSLKVGRDMMTSDGLVLITVVPARPADKDGPGYPSFLLYAGTGSPGLAEINSLKHGADGILVGDAFGAFIRGDWKPDGASGRAEPLFRVSQEREDLEHNTSTPLPLKGKKATAQVNLWSIRSAPDANDAPFRAAVMRGLEASLKKLGIESPPNVDVFLYPSHAIKEKLTGNKGDGHAVVYARALHLVKFGAEPGGPLERLAAHEGTHVFAHEAWGPPGSAFLGEGLAVWVAGTYGGTPLDGWRTKLADRDPIATLMTLQFARMPESETYPQAGLFVGAAVREIGLEKVRDHLYGATPATWEAACAAAGTTAEKLEAAATAPTP